MIIRALVCCAVLIFGLLAALSATAQSAGTCGGAACAAAGKPKPLNLMSFMNGASLGSAASVGAAAPAKAAATKHRRPTKTARAKRDAAPSPATPSQDPAVSAAAAAAYAEHTEGDVQVVSSDQLNSIDLAASKPARETSGASPRTDQDDRDRVKLADAGDIRAEQFQPASKPAPAPETTTTRNSNTIRDDSWMGRFWFAIGDGFVALVAMVRHLFG